MSFRILRQIVGAIIGARQVGLYQFTDRRGRLFNALYFDSVMRSVSGSQSHGARDYVLRTLRETVAADTRCPSFEVPREAYLWTHPSLGFKDITRLRGARPSERKQYIGSPLRTAFTDYIDYVRTIKP